MNRLFRLLWLLLFARRRPRVSPMGPCRTHFRVWLTDLDVLRHMNNGIYLSIMDLARVDLMIRSGLAPVIQQKGWYPVVVAETIQFRRSLNLFDAFEIETRALGWDDKAIVLEQQFFRGGEAVAYALVRTRFLQRGGGAVTPRELALAGGFDPQSPVLPGFAAEWNAQQAEWRGRR